MLALPARRVALELQGFDAAYLERLRSGHPETEQHFVTYFGRLILIKLRCRLRSWPQIEDVRQETFLRVLRKVRSPGGIRDPTRLGAFVVSVCNNVLLEQWHTQDRYRPTADEPDARAGTTGPDPEANLITEETKAMVRRVIGELKDRDRDLLRAVFLEERDKDEVCAEFGVDRGYLRVLLHRAINRFRELYLERQGPTVRAASIGGGRRASRRSAES